MVSVQVFSCCCNSTIIFPWELLIVLFSLITNDHWLALPHSFRGTRGFKITHCPWSKQLSVTVLEQSHKGPGFLMRLGLNTCTNCLSCFELRSSLILFVDSYFSSIFSFMACKWVLFPELKIKSYSGLFEEKIFVCLAENPQKYLFVSSVFFSAVCFSLTHRKGILCPWRPLSIRPWQRPSYCRWCQPTGHDSLPTPTCYAACRPAHAPYHRATPSPQDAFDATLWPAAATGRLPNDW